MNIIRAFHDRNLLGYGVHDFSSFKNWEVCQRAIYGLALISDERAREIYTRYTHRTDEPQACKEAVLVNGRRSGKSFMMAVSAVHGALFKFGGKKPFLRRGEKLTIKVLAQDREAARTVMRYIEGLLEARAHAFEFADDVIIEVGTADYRSVRSYTIGMAICDEACFWSSDDGTNPAEAILAAVRPAMKTVPGSLMIIASSPYSRRGPVWDRYEKWFGVANPHTLVWQAATLDMNPTIDPAEIELEFMLDPANAAAEYGANFRSDVEVLLSKERYRQFRRLDNRQQKARA